MSESTLWIIGFVSVVLLTVLIAVITVRRFQKPSDSAGVSVCTLIWGWGLVGALMGLYYNDSILVFVGVLPLFVGAGLTLQIWKQAAKKGVGNVRT